ncbi:unnamed protein product [Rhizoctonia solani]|uniref:Uncharacterized protein n=1 Tax=Rhizoctonia solani TaxID=456999 RepID=A0A8H3E9Q9_9AGAM|nr:unnamed protein product [Rhizoctonia solani]
MVAFLWNWIILAPAALVLAIPTPNETAKLSKRTITGSRGATCATNAFTVAEVGAAAQTAANLLNAGATVGPRNHPHQYPNFQGFVFEAGCNPPFFEFPILKTGIYNGGLPGPDRVIIGSMSSTSADAAFCGGCAFLLTKSWSLTNYLGDPKGVITRTGAHMPNGFVGCTLI